MTSKWGGLAANVSTPARLTILHPATGEPIADKSGKCAYLDLMSMDSAAGRKVSKGQAQAQLKSAAQLKGGGDDPDPSQDQADMLAALACGWYLVDPLTGSPIDHAFSGVDSARELFTADEMQWLRRQAYIFVVSQGNFMPPLPKS